MIVHSLVSFEGRLQPVEVEIELTPGLPQMHFLGLADQGIKESIYRIKCALRQQGFEYPRTQQILVNLRPSHFRKSSRGLELAVAAGLLAKTEQIKWPKSAQNFVIYGELSLSGEVHEPDDLLQYVGQPDKTLLTGTGQASPHFEKLSISHLSQLAKNDYQTIQVQKRTWKRPSLREDLKWSESQAQWLKLMACGGHHGLLAGPSGLGKTTLAQTLVALMPEPEGSLSQNYEQNFEALDWRPMIQPHHTISSQGLLGGGVPLAPGEISRAHGGALLLDELLEFDSSCLESLREPLEEGVVRLRKNNRRQTFPADFQLVATTNLCKCGDWVPGARRDCHYSQIQCLSTLRRVTGPFLDRFQILYFVRKDTSANISSTEILEQLLEIYEFQKAQSRPARNNRLLDPDLQIEKSLFEIHSLIELSPRRRLSTLRVARSLADLEKSVAIESKHLSQARQWSLQPFLDLKKGPC